MPPDWRRSCRQCGKPTVPGRAWCRLCLARMLRGLPTDLIDIPTHDRQRSVTSGGPDIPFPFWPKRP